MADTTRRGPAPSGTPSSDGWTSEAITALADEIDQYDDRDLRGFINYLCGYAPATVNVAYRAWKPYWALHNERYPATKE